MTAPAGAPAAFPYAPLTRPLTRSQRTRVRAHLLALLRWQHTLRDWPGVLPRAPDATPFVALYARGKLLGCYGSAEGAPGERLARAFLLALSDGRAGGVRAEMRPGLTAQVSYPRAPRAVQASEALTVLEPGTHGVVLTRGDGAVFAVLPSVARERRAGARGMLEAAARKAGLAPGEWVSAKLTLFETEELSAHPGESSEDSGESPEDEAARWLAARVGRDGAVALEVDARAGSVHATGEGHHARAAVALAALAAHGGHRAAVKRGRAWLRAQWARRAESGWPAAPGPAAGALALSVRAGAVDARALREWVGAHATEVARAPWYAAQVVTVLGADAPPGVLEACVRDLAARPFAPWTLLAARAAGDGAARSLCERALCDALRGEGLAHAGGAGVTEVPEVALTAAAVEALSGCEGAAARAAVARARGWIARWQLVRGRVPAALDPAWAEGAFLASPVNDRLRCDVTGHALLALLGA